MMKDVWLGRGPGVQISGPAVLTALLQVGCPGVFQDRVLDGETEDGGSTSDGGSMSDGGSTSDGGSSDGGGTSGDGGSSDGGTSGDGGTGGDGGSEPWVVYEEVQATDLGWEVHEEVGSLIRVRWTQTAPAYAWVEFRLSEDGEESAWWSSPREVVEPGATEVLLAGIPYGAELSWRLHNDFGEGGVQTDAFAAAAGPLPDEAPQAVITVSDLDGYDADARFVLTSVRALGWTWLLIVDRQGRLVWAHQVESQLQSFWPSISRDGSALMWDQTDFFSEDDRVVRASLDLSIWEELSTPDHHHAFAETEDGAIAWNAWAEDSSDSRPGESIQELLSTGEQRQLYLGLDDWQTNSLWWDEDTDEFIVSYYTTQSVLRIDRESGEVRDTWGPSTGWSFDPPESRFWFQHGAHLTEAGTLLMSAHASEDSSEGVVREYELDEATQTLRLIWSAGDGEGVEAAYYGEARRLPGGNTAHNFGATAWVREYSPEGEVVWELRWEDGAGGDAALIGRMTFLDELWGLVR